MEKSLRDSTGACIYCGAIAMIKDLPCDCTKAKEAQARQQVVAAGKRKEAAPWAMNARARI